MIKGGYKIVNFNGAALSGTAVELSGIYAQIVDDYYKPIMVSGVSLNGDIMDDAYAGVQEKIAGDLSKSVELTVYGGIITVTEDDEVSFVVSKTPAELTAEIGDLDDLETTDKDSAVDAINEINIKSLHSPDYSSDGIVTITGTTYTATEPLFVSFFMIGPSDQVINLQINNVEVSIKDSTTIDGTQYSFAAFNGYVKAGDVITHTYLSNVTKIFKIS